MKTSTGYKTLGEATRFLAKQHMKIEDNTLAQYIKSAVEILQAQGKDIEDYALIKVNNPMQLKDDNTATITTQWRLIHVSKLESVPQYND